MFFFIPPPQNSQFLKPRLTLNSPGFFSKAISIYESQSHCLGFWGCGNVVLEKIFSTKMKKKFWRNLLKKDHTFFWKFWFLVEKKDFKIRNFYRQEQIKKIFWKSGQGSFSKILFFHEKCKKFPKILARRINNFGFFSEKNRKFLQNLKSPQQWRMRKIIFVKNISFLPNKVLNFLRVI